MALQAAWQSRNTNADNYQSSMTGSLHCVRDDGWGDEYGCYFSGSVQALRAFAMTGGGDEHGCYFSGSLHCVRDDEVGGDKKLMANCFYSIKRLTFSRPCERLVKPRGNPEETRWGIALCCLSGLLRRVAPRKDGWGGWRVTGLPRRL